MQMLKGNHFPFAHGFVLVAVPRFWEPSQLGDLALWLDADDASTITLNGSTVSAWQDKSPNLKNTTQSIASKQPLYVIDGLNSQNIVRFDGIDDALSRSDSLITGSANRSIFIVAKQSDQNGAVFDHGTNVAYGRYSIKLNTGFIGIFGANIQWSTVGDPNFGIYAFVQNGIQIQNISAFWNGTSYASTSSVNPTSILNTGSSEIVLGREVGSSVFTDVDIAEVVVTPSATDTEDRENVEGYLAWKWGSI